MAKIKNKKRNLADNVHKKVPKKTMNPFEVHINKEKMRVIGKKEKNDRGLPGVSRAKALKKRKHTLLQEYKVQNKTNKFVDKRIGEKNHTMVDEDKVMARFTAVRVKQHNRKSIFNLADDEVLTHKGQTLSEIEKFDDPRSDDDDDEETSGKLESNFVEDAHFGGGILKKAGEGYKTHRELIDQLIAESKKRKAEQQKTKEVTLELTEKLDTEWKDLLPLVNRSKPKVEDQTEAKVDDYDKVMRELRFEARGTVSDRLKTEDEVAREEKEKLEQLEQERLERMKGIVDETKPKTNHRSADDLDENFVYDSDPEYMLSYNKEGESNVEVEAEINGRNIKDKNEDESEEENENDEESAEDEEDSESEDNLSDLKEDDSESEEEMGEEIVEEPKIDKIENNTETIKEDLLKRKEIMEKARQELPYTFTLPDSYESLQKLFENRTSAHQSVILERMIKCNHPSLAVTNKENLSLLFAYILQYLNDLSSETDSIKTIFDVFNAITPQIYELAQLNPENAHKSMVELIKEKQNEFRKRSKFYPGLEILIFFKLISVLFTTSDYRHQVVTPCFVFMEQMLTKCKVKTKRDISYGLFVTTLVLEYVSLSKRYLPAAVNFLAGLLHMCIPKSGVKLVKVIPPFKSISNHLVLLDNCTNLKDNLKMNCTDLENSDELNNEFKVRVFNTTLNLLNEFVELYKELSSCVEVFEHVFKYLELIPTENYPEIVRNNHEKLVDTLKDLKTNRKLIYVRMAEKKPKALRLYEPKIVEMLVFKLFLYNFYLILK